MTIYCEPDLDPDIISSGQLQFLLQQYYWMACYFITTKSERVKCFRKM